MDKTTNNARSGYLLGVEMIEELDAQSTHTSPCGVEAEFREPGKPQYDIAGKYLAKAREGGFECEAGFTAFLSEFISSCVGGGVPGASFLRELVCHVPDVVESRAFGSESPSH